MKKFLLVVVILVFVLVLMVCGGFGVSLDKVNGLGKVKDGGFLIIGVIGDLEVINLNYVFDCVILMI